MTIGAVDEEVFYKVHKKIFTMHYSGYQTGGGREHYRPAPHRGNYHTQHYEVSLELQDNFGKVHRPKETILQYRRI
jgi:hypothetical protein